jgi:hypothetical protein
MSFESSRPVFDAAAARDAGEAGKSLAADNNITLLRFAQGVAREIGRRKVFVSADEVQRELIERHGWEPNALGNAAGSLFKGKAWRWDGETKKSEMVDSHGRLIRIWRYVGQ